MMFDIVFRYRDQLARKIQERSIHNGSVKKEMEDYLIGVGFVQGLKEAQTMYEVFLKNLSSEEDE